jgi:hypothetical protein
LAIIKLTKDLFENVSIVGRPHRTYVTSSSGPTGSLTLSSRPSERISEITIGRIDSNSEVVQIVSDIALKAQDPNNPIDTRLFSSKNKVSLVKYPSGGSTTVGTLTPSYAGKKFIFSGSHNDGTPFPQPTSVVSADIPKSLQPEYFHVIQKFKKRKIADIKKHYISASFYDSDVRVAQQDSISYNKINMSADLLQYRDAQIIEEDRNIFFTIPYTSVDADKKSLSNVYVSQNTALIWPYNKEYSSRNSLGLRYVKDVLMDKFKSRYDNCDYSFTNFQCLNFLTSSFTNSDAVLVYPNSAPTPGNQHLLATSQQITASGGPYTVEKQMTVDFWINPKYDNVKPDWPFRAGTIMHHSSSYAISLTSGSYKDNNDLVDSYRILVQLGSTAAVKSPSTLSPSSVSPGEFWSRDGLLRKNHWHRVTILINTPSDCEIIIDDFRDSITNAPLRMNTPTADQTVGHHGQIGLFVGNFYDGKYDQVRNFFSADISDREGFFEADSITDHRYENKVLSSGASTDVGIGAVNLTHPLCAEIHDLKLYRKKLTNFEFSQVKNKGVYFEKDNPKKLAFYLPVLFNPRCRVRKTLTSPYTEEYDRPYTPTNSNFSLGVGGKLINLENYVKDYAQGNLPRLYHLTESLNSYINTDSETAATSELAAGTVADRERILTNKFIYDFKGSSTNESFIASKGRTQRNLMILPCDNGQSTINYNCLQRDLDGHSLIRTNNKSDYTDNTNTNELSVLDFSKPINANIEKRMTNSLDNLAINKVSLRNYLTKSFTRGDEVVPTKGDRLEFYPISYILENTDSRDVSLFSVPSLFYGERIHPGSMKISSDTITGSQGMMKVSVQDNGKGMLYRADALTAHATGACVGNIFYNEGLILYKNPHPLYFGKGGFTFDFKGEHTTHSLQINAPCPKNLIFSSSNPSYRVLSASDAPNDQNNDFVYLTNINIHDDNLNVIMKASLSQPVIKRGTDSFLFKLRQDF